MPLWIMTRDQLQTGRDSLLILSNSSLNIDTSPEYGRISVNGTAPKEIQLERIGDSINWLFTIVSALVKCTRSFGKLFWF